MADSSKTEKATPKRRRDERKKGNVLMSRDMVSVATLVGAAGTLWLLSGTIANEIAQYMAYCINNVKGTTETVSAELLTQAVMVLVKTAVPLLLVTAICAVAITFLQTKFLISPELLKPKFNRLSPIQGFKRLFSLKSVIEALKGILKIAVLLILIYNNLTGMFKESIKYLYTDIGAAASHLVRKGFGMIVQIVVAFVVLAAADYIYQWWEYERQMRMSKQEIKEEYKQTEGDPQVKGKIKEVQRQRAQMRMMQQVPQADVVIRNPTHFAVALRYKPEQDSAPIVLAKGQDELAMRIVRKAEEHEIKVIENVPLARALYAQAELNRQIPPDLYGPVAEVLVYIFRLDKDKKIVK